jgi:hypothetical protein
MFKLQFKPEITAGQIIIGFCSIGAVLGVWKDVSVDVALLKQGQAQQAETINTIRIDIREIRREARPATPPAARGG